MPDSTDIPALVAKVRELDKVATPGPWEHNGYDGHPAMAVWTPDPELEDGNSSAKMICREGDYFGEESRAPVEERAENIQLIALYRTAAPVLADEVVRLREALAAALQEVDALKQDIELAINTMQEAMRMVEPKNAALAKEEKEAR